jgi:hypothetical protein
MPSKAEKDKLVEALKDFKATVVGKELHDEEGNHDGYYVNLTFPASRWSLHRLNDMSVELITLGKKISPTIDYDGCAAIMP